MPHVVNAQVLWLVLAFSCFAATVMYFHNFKTANEVLACFLSLFLCDILSPPRSSFGAKPVSKCLHTR